MINIFISTTNTFITKWDTYQVGLGHMYHLAPLVARLMRSFVLLSLQVWVVEPVLAPWGCLHINLDDSPYHPHTNFYNSQTAGATHKAS